MAKRKSKKEHEKKDKGKDIILVFGLMAIFAVMFWIIINSNSSSKTSVENTSSTSTTIVPTVREPAVAGAFYSKNKEMLSANIDGYLRQAAEFPEVYGVRGIVSPHAGYIYSGPVAAYGFKQLAESRYETVIVLGPSHRFYLQKAFIPDVVYYRTPLGDVPLSPKVKDMLQEEIFTSKPTGADSREHSLEVQVPFLQKVLPPFKIIPVMVGDVDPKKLADALLNYIDEDTLIVASTDLSHYKPYDDCVSTDKNTIDSIVKLDYDKMLFEGDACGKIPTLTLIEIAKRKGWRTKLFDYRNSGDTAGDKNAGVVGYTSIGFYDGLDETEQEKLLDIVKQTLISHYSGGEYKVNESELPPKLLEVKGCFVTLNKNKKLRGCVGHLIPQEKLYECVVENALNAALDDSRFRPVTEDELKDIKIEVSVLTTPRPLQYDSPQDLLDKLIPGVDGVILKSANRQSTYLPSVWEMLPNKEEFLGQLCLKGGSPAICWKTAQIHTYQAQEFHEEGFK